MTEYVDVRGVDPVYVKGVLAIKLVGAPRSITTTEALTWKAK